MFIKSFQGKYLLLGMLIAGMVFGTLPAQKKKKEKEKSETSPTQATQTNKPDMKEFKRVREAQLFIDAATEFAKGELDQAYNLYQNVVTDNPEVAAAYAEMSRIRFIQRKYAESLELAKTAFQKQPSNYWYEVLVAEAALNARELSLAVKTLESISKKYPGDRTALMRLAECYLMQDNPTKAIDCLNRLEAQEGPEEALTIEKARISLERKMPQDAAKEIRKYLNFDPTSSSMYEMLYEIYLTSGDKEKSGEVLEELTKYAPDPSYLILALTGRLLDVQNEKDYADRINGLMQDKNVSLDTKAQAMLNLLIQAWQKESNRPFIRNISKSLLTQYPDSADALQIYGDVFNADEKIDSARLYYKKAVAKDDINEDRWRALLMIDAASDSFGLLNKDAEEALVVFPLNPLFLFFSGISSFQIGNTELARTRLEKMLKINQEPSPYSENAWSTLAEIYHDAGLHDKSDDAFTKALNINPENAVSLNNFAYYLSLRNVRLEDAEKMIQKAIQLQPNTASFEDTYGWVLYMKGEYKSAIKWLEIAISHGGGADVMEHTGDAYFKLNNTEKALEYWKKAREKKDNDPILDEKIKTGKL